ncbi:sensor histidine kinase [Leptospira wolffii]|uniref:sensor histidine kinase n=1 Tax=Leptospira wolffii TaxID=409998 RepID=UPI001082AA74|nr:ATP-binding protein [Leptospira wolffii]TGK62576.1 sensor histidine kinase [Leptospira wolffii]TGK65551.1 sensor histidine kinase [Leptospira wolffii]TGK74039.1 sensor histidine kinase [Leptospira wolffii]TGL28898.1 sensor histidine kinase [Leptospira wolffii]
MSSLLLNLSSAAALVTKDGIIIEGNDPFWSLIGTSIGQEIRYVDWIHSADLEHELKLLEKDSGLSHYEMVKRLKNEEGQYVAFHSVTSKTNNGDSLHLFFPLDGPVSHEPSQASIYRTGESVKDAEIAIYRRAIEIFDWKQSLKDRYSSSAWMDSAIKQINITLMQGTGIGSLMSVLSMILSKAKRRSEDGVVEIRENLFDLLEDGVSSASRFTRFLSSAQALFEENDVVEEVGTVAEFVDTIREVIDEVESSVSIKRQRILVSDNIHILSNRLKFRKAWIYKIAKEILINALKYSPDDSNILILILRIGDELQFKVINDPPFSGYVQEFHEDLVFEPFYRGVKFMDERYTQEEFGMGLGLPVVKKLVELQGGKVHLQTMNLNLDENRKEGICLTMRFPVVR